MTQKAVVLFSGGLDSTTTLAIAKDQGFTPCALSFRYGQRHAVELESATQIAQQQALEQHVIADIDLRLFGGSALTADIDVPMDRDPSSMESGIPATYVPARNTIFLSYALAWAEVLECYHIFIGVNALDYSGYPDCRPEYIQAYETMANLATKSAIQGGQKVHIHTPLINLSKSDIIKKGTQLGVDYSRTSSCYSPEESGRPCQRCDSCLLRAKGFDEAGLSDPLIQRFAN
jgi:7-cyano-7-deazaguanine synthase